MKHRIFTIGVAFAAILSGCSDEFENAGVKNPVQEGEEVLFGTSLAGGATSRTAYGDRDQNGVPVEWVEGDEIAIFCKETSQPANHLVNYKITPSGDDPAKASEVMKVDPNSAGLQWGSEDLHHFYAFYPASAVHGAESDDQQGTITASIPVNQQPAGWRTGPIVSQDDTVNGATTTFALPNMNYAYMYAYNAVDKKTVESGSGTIWLQFHNLVTVLDITIPAPLNGSVVVTDVTVRAVGGNNTILTGEFDCKIREAGEGADAKPTCSPAGDMGQVRNVINIPCYDKDNDEFITLGDNEKYLNVKAYLIPDDVSGEISQQTLQIAVSTLNGGEKKRTLHQATIKPHMINRVLLPPVDPEGTNYWMSDLDPNIYLSELSIPGSKFSVLTEENGASRVYQNATIEQQFQDGIRAFIFQTATKGRNTNIRDDWWQTWQGYPGSNNSFEYENFSVACESKDKPVMTLAEAIQKIAVYLDACEQQKKYNEFAFVMLTYTTGDYDLGAGDPGITHFYYSRNPADPEQFWIEKLRDEVNKLDDEIANRIYTGEITPNTTIDDVKGKIILKANYNSENMISNYGETNAPIMFTWWNGPYGPKNTDGTYYQDTYNGMPMDWGKPVWYLNSPANLRWYYQEVTSVGEGQESSVADKKKFIETLFTKSVNLYKNDNAHKTWFMNDLGGYYSDKTNIGNRESGIAALAEDMNDLGVQQLQERTENAGLGLIFMNFADKQATSGAKYKSDYLIQTIIMNNRKFQLRKKGDSQNTRTEYVTPLSAGEGWDE